MADNTVLNSGSGGDTIATDDIGGVKYPRGKVCFGADGSASDVSTANPLPVQLRRTSDGAEIGIAALPLRTDPTGTTPQPVTDNGGSLTVDGWVAVSNFPATQPVSAAALPLPSGAATETTLGTRLSESDFDTKVGSLTETAPTTDTASSGLNGRLQRIAQRLTSLIALVPAALTGSGNFKIALNEVVAGIFGNVASDAVDSGNPVKIGGQGRSTDITAVADADRVDFIATLLGKQIVKLDAVPGNTWSYAAAAGGLVTTTGVTAKAAAGAGIRNYVKSISVINSHQTTGTEVVIRDGAAGTVLWRGWAQPAGGGCAVVFDPPLRGSANTLIEIAEVTTTGTAGVLVNLSGFVAAE